VAHPAQLAPSPGRTQVSAPQKTSAAWVEQLKHLVADASGACRRYLTTRYAKTTSRCTRVARITRHVSAYPINTLCFSGAGTFRTPRKHSAPQRAMLSLAWRRRLVLDATCFSQHSNGHTDSQQEASMHVCVTCACCRCMYGASAGRLESCSKQPSYIAAYQLPINAGEVIRVSQCLVGSWPAKRSR
jgi:hypothetical protein